jgi:hypothetical protein
MRHLARLSAHSLTLKDMKRRLDSRQVEQAGGRPGIPIDWLLFALSSLLLIVDIAPLFLPDAPMALCTVLCIAWHLPLIRVPLFHSRVILDSGALGLGFPFPQSPPSPYFTLSLAGSRRAAPCQTKPKPSLDRGLTGETVVWGPLRSLFYFFSAVIKTSFGNVDVSGIIGGLDGGPSSQQLDTLRPMV